MSTSPRDFLVLPDPKEFGKPRNGPGLWAAESDAVLAAKLQEQVALELRALAGGSLSAWCANHGITRDTVSKMVTGERRLTLHLLQRIVDAMRARPTPQVIRLPSGLWAGKSGVGMVNDVTLSDDRERIVENARTFGPIGRDAFGLLVPEIQLAAHQLLAAHGDLVDPKRVRVRLQARNHGVAPVAGFRFPDETPRVELFMPANRDEQLAALGMRALPDGRFIVQACAWDEHGQPTAVHALGVAPLLFDWADEFVFVADTVPID